MSALPISLPQTKRRFWPPAVIVFACALLARVAVLYLAADSVTILPAQSDMRFYSEWAQRIIAGAWTDHKAFYGLPGYAYWLALIYGTIGFQPFLVSLFQQVLEAGTATLLFLIGSSAFARPEHEREKGERRRGWLIGGLAAAGWTFCTPAQAYSMALMPTAYLICAFWFVVWWTLHPRATGRPRPLAFLGLGLLMGGVAMMVANILFLAPFVLAAICLRAEWRPFPWRARAGAAALLVGGVFVGASPCALHNYFAAGEPVFLSAHSGINFYVGNNAHANGYPFIPAPLHADQTGMLADSIYYAEQAAGRPLKRVEVSEYWSQKARQFIAENPGQWVRLLGTKLANFWNSYPYDDLDLLLPMHEEGILPPGITFGLAAALGLPGALLALWRRPRARWIVAAVVLHMGSLLTVFVTERYRLAAAPGLLLLGAFGLVEVGRELATLFAWTQEAVPVRRMALGTVALYAVALVGATFATHRAVAPDLTSHDLYNSSLTDIENNRYDRALEKLERVRALVPNNAETYFAMGNAWVGKEDFGKAMVCYRRVIALDPRHHRAFNNLAVIAYQEKSLRPAEQLLVAALSIEPNDAKANFLLACVRRDLGDREGARVPAAAALRQRPDSEEYRKLNEELTAPVPISAVHTASALPAIASGSIP